MPEPLGDSAVGKSHVLIQMAEGLFPKRPGIQVLEASIWPPFRNLKAIFQLK
jgi:hypothetical protein